MTELSKLAKRNLCGVGSGGAVQTACTAGRVNDIRLRDSGAIKWRLQRPMHSSPMAKLPQL